MIGFCEENSGFQYLFEECLLFDWNGSGSEGEVEFNYINFFFDQLVEFTIKSEEAKNGDFF